MGAFLLYKTGKDLNIDRACRVFENKGFSSPAFFNFGKWSLIVFSKIIKPINNYVSIDNITLVSIGTPLYKGMDYENSLKNIVKDYKNGMFKPDRLIGQYSLLFCNNEEIVIYEDPLGSKHLFIDSSYSVISSSMLAVVEALVNKLHINRAAVYEKYLTGFIMRPNTVFDEIFQLNSEILFKIKDDSLGITIFPEKGCLLENTNNRIINKKKCISEQAEVLLNHFGQLKNAGRKGIDIGLSGGYDSRLVLACINKYCHDNLHLHSHATENKHNDELGIANKLANYVGNSCHVVKTKKLANCSNIDNVLKNSVLYFDGRTSFSIGGCEEVYTFEYRKQSTENIPMTITGIGGELYRNVFSIGSKYICLAKFLKKKVFSNSLKKAMEPKLYKEISDELIKTIAQKMKIDENAKLPKEYAHKYYCEIMMPDGQGNAIDAYNQVSCCVAPFIEPSIIKKGYEGIIFHGSGGDFEGSLIDLIDHNMASIDSVYGYPLNHKPLKYQIKEFVRVKTPDIIWNKMGKLKNKKSNKENNKQTNIKVLCQKSDNLDYALNKLYTIFPEISFDVLMNDEEELKRTVFLAMTFFLFRERIIV